MTRKDPEAEHSFKSHLSHIICIGQWTMCSRPNGTLDVDSYSELEAPARPMKLAGPWMTPNAPEAECLSKATLVILLVSVIELCLQS